ncbi:hypothetical protein SAMN04487894_103336 [Niabella drilacis]|uniref:Uncharacterized protein n=1 Tax=Niabella drilacis (strain DSM 25811 / CCM 8410 / CCUG 62505 / LMG 26954 / E90) TaxID=1285928 RepID=A0A1G6NNE7_NIADE|nr:hypothetical protein SAMN04487894_103336 [Niabella drilacis]
MQNIFIQGMLFSDHYCFNIHFHFCLGHKSGAKSQVRHKAYSAHNNRIRNGAYIRRNR